MFKTKLIVSSLALLMFAAGCSSSDDKKAAASSTPVLIGEYVASNDSYSKLREALDATQLSDVIFEEGNMTFFAPTDEAFNKIDPMTLDLLISQAQASEDGSGILKDILMYHLVNGVDADSGSINEQIESSETQNFVTPETVLGPQLEIVKSESDLVVNGENSSAKIIEADIASTNGVIHSIDTLLNPTDMAFPLAPEQSEEDQAAEDVEEGAEEVAQDVEEGAENAEQGAEEAADDVEAGAEEAAQDVEEGAENAEQGAEEAADDVEAGAEEAAQDVEEGAENLEQNAEEAADSAEEDLDRSAEDVEEEADRVTEDVEEEADRVSEDVEEEADRVMEDIEEAF